MAFSFPYHKKLYIYDENNLYHNLYNMNITKHFCVLFLLMAGYFTSFAQTNNPLINSGDIIKRADALSDDGKYKDAIDLYKQISRSDSNYVDALYELSSSCYSDSEMEASYKYAKMGADLFPERFTKFVMQEANALDAMKKPEEAVVLYDQVLAKDPQSAITYFNKSISLIAQQKEEEAKVCLEKCLLINPYYKSAHYFLGKIFLKEGKLIPAMLAFKTYMLVAPSGKYAVATVGLMSDIAKVTDDVTEYDKNKVAGKDDDFDFLQQILISKVALDREYKLKAALEDPIVRQIQVVDEKLQYNKNDKGFCMQFYVPLYQQIFADGNFEPMIFTMFSGLNIKSVGEWNKKHKKQVDPFVSNAADYLNKIRSTRILNAVERKAAADNYLYAEGEYVGKGAYTKDKDGNYQLSGDWLFYYDNGALKTKGAFNSDYKKEGPWVFYYDNGELKEKVNYKNGDQVGLAEGWWDNGNRWYNETFVDNKTDGVQTLYYFNDNVNSITTYKADKKNGPEKSYNSDGELTYTTNYTDDEEDGAAKSFYGPSGIIKDEVTYKAGKAQGTYKSFTEKGAIATQGEFVDNQKQGLWTTYYPSGAVKEKTTYANGEITGEFTEYFENGQLSRKGNYTNKKIDGKLEDYDEDGKKYSDAVYEKGKLREINFYDKSGKNISAITTRKGAANIIFYLPDGSKTSECYFNNDGNRDGKNVDYFPSGKIKEVSYYKNGIQQGSDIGYFANGQERFETNYIDGNEDGYTKGFFSNGQLNFEVWRVKGQKQQHMIYYNNLGDVTSIENYLNDDEDGYAEYKYPKNIPDDDYKYSSGWLESMTQFDSTGNVIASATFNKGKGPIAFKNYNGKISAQGSYDHYMLNGSYKVYFFDGKLLTSMFYKNNKLDSNYKSYFYNGVLKTEGNYKNGEKEGVWKGYYENGKLSEEETYNNGNLEGEYRSYNIDGTKDFTANYKDNNKEGQTILYGDSNKINAILNYKDDNIQSYTYEDKNGTLVPPIEIKGGTGKVVGYYRNGIKSCELQFVDMEEDGVHNFFYSNGKSYIEGKRSSGYDNGPVTIYYPNGNFYRVESLVLGNLNGIRKTYYPNGKLQKEENYYNDELNGVCKYYDEQGNLKQTRVYFYDHLQSVK